MLYNLELDPGETNNVYNKYSQKVKELKAFCLNTSTKAAAQKGNLKRTIRLKNGLK